MPHFLLVEDDLPLARGVALALAGEGREVTVCASAQQARKALEAGAFALVVGGAITRPAEITARFTAAIKDLK